MWFVLTTDREPWFLVKDMWGFHHSGLIAHWVRLDRVKGKHSCMVLRFGFEVMSLHKYYIDVYCTEQVSTTQE